MLNHGIEALLRHELDTLPLPPEVEWVPEGSRRSAWRSTLWVLGAGAVIALALLIAPGLREAREAREAGRDAGAAAQPTPHVLPTVIDGIGVSPLRNAMRYPELGFNLVAPANFRETTRAGVPGPGPIGRVTLTAHSAEMERALLATLGANAQLPWDLVVEAWSANGSTASQWAQGPGSGCVAGCTFGTTTIRGLSAVTSISGATGRHAFYLQSGTRMLVISYVLGDGTTQPEGVTADTLEQMVTMIGVL